MEINHRPIALIILDGWGHTKHAENNAIAQAHTPCFDNLWNTYPHALLDASGEAIGLPKNQIGNSEIGHITIGCGRIIDTLLVRINQAIKNNEFISNPAFTQLFRHVQKYQSTLHVMGLVSAGGIHSHRDHLYAFLKAAKSAKIQRLAIHAFTDGRDVPPQSAATYLGELEDILDEIRIGFIATVSGRFYSMDRDKNWHRIQRAEEAIFEGKGDKRKTRKPSDVLRELYQQQVIDELLEPLVFLDDNGEGWPIQKNDGVFFFNYRPDRARQLSTKIAERKSPYNLCFVTMTQYEKTLEAIAAFPEEKIPHSLAETISRAGLRQAHISETEKYPHVTYFFNGGCEDPHKNERFILIESRKDVATHDKAPEMKAHEIASKAIEQIKEGTDVIILNFANADMVGHTANVPAIIAAIEVVDQQLNRVINAIEKAKGIALICSDHGNAETNIDEMTNVKHTAHTLNPVPCIVTEKKFDMRPSGTLADIAPTILQILKIPQPTCMTGVSLLKN